MDLTGNRFETLLNVGCGRCYHPGWTNVDLVPCGDDVLRCDLSRGLPFEDDRFDAVYHSHVLEHLTPADGAAMLRECHRVLKPGGVLRVVVPDLEGIAKAYLGSVAAAADGDDYARANHRWMTLELIDQMSRHTGGGEMGIAMNDPDQINRDFIRARVGEGSHPTAEEKKPISVRWDNFLSDCRKQITAAVVTLLDGRAGRQAYREGRFRRSGEIHRWMYDRVSLAQRMIEVGLEHPTVCQAHESRIDRFDDYQLDRVGGVKRKPDSLYMESVKPAAGSSAGAGDASPDRIAA